MVQPRMGIDEKNANEPPHSAYDGGGWELCFLALLLRDDERCCAAATYLQRKSFAPKRVLRLRMKIDLLIKA